MCEVYPVGCIQYICSHWIVYKEYFIRAWTDIHLHFGTRTTSRSEGNHWVMKRYLKISNMCLLSVLLKLKDLLEVQYVELNKSMEIERLKEWHNHGSILLKDLRGKVSKYALDKIQEHIDIVNMGNKCQAWA